MPIVVTCECGASYNLKNEFAGQQVQCPTCNRVFVAEAPVPVAVRAQADPVFARDKFLLRQKVVAINEKYSVTDENNQPVVFIERPAHLGQNLLAALVGLATCAVIAGGCIAGAIALSPDREPGPLAATLIIAGLVLGIVAGVAVGIALSAKRHVNFWSDDARSTKLLEILQDKKFQPVNQTFTVRDTEGNIIARLRKNVLYNLFRKRWYCLASDGALLATAKEDSILLSLMRRLLGPMLGLLRTNFIIFAGESEEIIGEFNRKLTLFDRYVLDLTADPTRALDRRIALAIGVMLDSGERR